MHGTFRFETHNRVISVRRSSADFMPPRNVRISSTSVSSEQDPQDGLDLGSRVPDKKAGISYKTFSSSYTRKPNNNEYTLPSIHPIQHLQERKKNENKVSKLQSLKKVKPRNTKKACMPYMYQSKRSLQWDSKNSHSRNQ